ncbi:MAG TPA: type II secretion system protein [Terriglobales bacterium]
MKFRSKAGSAKLRNPKAHSRGFTLMEMAVVITLILILVAVAVPMYSNAILRAKEAKLHQNLTTLNKVIQEYSLDKKHAPQSLDQLVPGYIKFIPDDITGSNDWVPDQEDSEDQFDPNQSGIKGVHSASNEISSEGTPYSSWTH